VGILHQMLGEVERAERTATELVALTRDYKLPMWLAWGRTLYGWSLLEQGQRERGLAEIAAGVASAEVARSAVMKIHFLGQLGEVFSTGSYVREPTWWSKDSHFSNRRGSVFARRSCTEHAGSSTWRAMLARRMRRRASGAESRLPAGRGALLLELRSATSLAELWTGQNLREEARVLLDDITGRFADGWEAPVLRKPRELLRNVR
jgi:hypothetical protein